MQIDTHNIFNKITQWNAKVKLVLKFSFIAELHDLKCFMHYLLPEISTYYIEQIKMIVFMLKNQFLKLL